MEECHADYETVIVDLQEKPEEFVNLYKKANPLPNVRAKVPLLHVLSDDDDDDDEFVLCESNVVAEYVADIYGPSSTLLPTNPNDKATMKLFTELCGTSFRTHGILVPAHQGDMKKFEIAFKSLKDELVNIDSFLNHVVVMLARFSRQPIYVEGHKEVGA